MFIPNIGDKVRLIRVKEDDRHEWYKKQGYIGQVFIVIPKPDHLYGHDTSSFYIDCPKRPTAEFIGIGLMEGDEYELVSFGSKYDSKHKENSTMSSNTKFYRVIKAHPVWEVGAILNNKDNSNQYELADEVWEKENLGGYNGHWEHKDLVEHQLEWFERVYELNTLGKLAYGTKEVAQAAAAKLFKTK